MSAWAIHESGMISQSIPDMIDSSVRVFTETASEHNQAIHDRKEHTKRTALAAALGSDTTNQEGTQ